MKASPSDQRSILDIARFDQQANSLRHKAANLPELAELASVTVKANNARDLRIAAETELNDVKRELSRAEGDVEQIVTRITRDEARLNGGSASPKELEQLQHEIATLKKRQESLEEIELEIMIRNDAVTARRNTLTTDLASLETLKTEINSRLTTATTEINLLINEKLLARKEVGVKIEQPLLDLYEKIRGANGGVGAAPLVGNKCNGCNLAINAVEMERIKSLAKDELLRCEECRRILVRI